MCVCVFGVCVCACVRACVQLGVKGREEEAPEAVQDGQGQAGCAQRAQSVSACVRARACLRTRVACVCARACCVCVCVCVFVCLFVCVLCVCVCGGVRSWEYMDSLRGRFRMAKDRLDELKTADGQVGDAYGRCATAKAVSTRALIARLQVRGVG